MPKDRKEDRKHASPDAGGGGERSEPKPPASGGAAAPPALAAKGAHAPSQEVPAKPSRRRHTAEYKARIVREADACAPGGIGAILRREGLYASQLASWRKQQEAGLSQKPGRKAGSGKQASENARQERKIRQLTERLRKAELIIEVQKKLCIALGLEPHPGLEAE